MLLLQCLENGHIYDMCKNPIKMEIPRDFVRNAEEEKDVRVQEFNQCFAHFPSGSG